MINYEAKKMATQHHANSRAFFCEHFPIGGIGAEIGVFYGQFSEIILRVAKPKILYLVDPWSQDDKFGYRTPEQMEEIYLEVKRKFSKTNTFENKCQLLRVFSFRFFNQFNRIALYKGPIFDFIYIDGSHESFDVSLDLNGSWDIVKPGGIIAGDDYDENIPLWGNSIKRAVDYFCQEKGITPELFDVPGEIGKQFLIKR